MDYYTGQIILWAGIKVPKDWALCDGRTLPIAGNEPLYSIIGTTYGAAAGRPSACPTCAAGCRSARGRAPA